MDHLLQPVLEDKGNCTLIAIIYLFFLLSLSLSLSGMRRDLENL